MKGIVLAGGTGSRLYPLTRVSNKHLLPVGRKPMIFHPIETLTRAGIEEICIVTGIPHMGDIVSLLGSGKEFNCRFTYKVQDEAGGIAQALSLVKNFCGDDKMAVILGDNIFEDNIKEAVEHFQHIPAESNKAMIFLKKVFDPRRYGVAQVDNLLGHVHNIEEKPLNPKSDLAVTGLYMYGPEVFEVIENLVPSRRGELEITDVNNWYVKRFRMNHHVLSGYWTDAGTFESLKRASDWECERVKNLRYK